MSEKLTLVPTDGRGPFEVALEIAREWNKNVDDLCKAVLTEDYKTAKLLAKELQNETLHQSH